MGSPPDRPDVRLLSRAGGKSLQAYKKQSSQSSDYFAVGHSAFDIVHSIRFISVCICLSHGHQSVPLKISQIGPVHVYVLRSGADGDRYVGLSTNVPQRVEEHNSGKVKSTKARAPFVLVYQESFDSLVEARAREKYFKTAAGRRWLDKRGF